MSFNKKYLNNIKMILAEVSNPGDSALLSKTDIEALVSMIENGYDHPDLKSIIFNPEITAVIKREQLCKASFTAEAIEKLKSVMKNNGNIPDVAQSVNSKPIIGALSGIRFNPKEVSGVILLAENTVCIYRTGIAEPINVTFADFDSAEKAFNNLSKSIEW